MSFVLTLYWPEDAAFSPGSTLVGWAWRTSPDSCSVVVAPPCATSCAQPQPVGVLPATLSLPVWLCAVLHGLPNKPTSRVTVLYTPPRRGCCACQAHSQLQRALSYIDAAAPHTCQQPPPPLPCSPAPPRFTSALLSELARLTHPSLIDVAVGLCFGALLLRNLDAAERTVRVYTAQVLHVAPAAVAHWLLAAKPLGVKLHAPLCEALSVAVLHFAAAVAEAGVLAAPLTRPALRALAWSGALGASLQLAMLADALALLALPLAALRLVASAWLSLHVAGIRNLWRKLYRPTAATQAQTEAYRVERLTVGALLLTPLLLLAPTLLVYGGLIAVLAALPAGARAALRTAPALLRSLPWLRLAIALLPQRSSRQSWLQPLACHACRDPVMRLHR